MCFLSHLSAWDWNWLVPGILFGVGQLISLMRHRETVAGNILEYKMAMERSSNQHRQLVEKIDTIEKGVSMLCHRTRSRRLNRSQFPIVRKSQNS